MNQDKILINDIHHISDNIYYASFIFYAYGTDGKIYVYVDHVGDGIEWWFNDEHNPYDDNDSCVDGVKNGENIDNLREGRK